MASIPGEPCGRPREQCENDCRHMQYFNLMTKLIELQ